MSLTNSRKARSKKVKGIFECEASNILNEKRKLEKAKEKVTPHVGPRTKLMYYINNMKLSPEEAMKKVLGEFKGTVSSNDLIAWYREEKEKEGKGGDLFDLSR